MTWLTVCSSDRLTPDRGVAVLVGDVPVALFKLADGSLYAVDHHDPVAGAPVMARGLVGSVGDTPYLVSPLLKERYDLKSGECIDSSPRRIGTWAVQVANGNVQIGNRLQAAAAA